MSTHTFDYNKTGLCDHPAWRVATAMCFQWLNEEKGDELTPAGLDDFMYSQPVRAAKAIVEKCDSWTQESVTLVLLGPARGKLLSGSAVEEAVYSEIFGERLMDLARYIERSGPAMDAQMARDAKRIAQVEAVSLMNGQIINSGMIDRHNDVRWQLVRQFEEAHKGNKGVDVRLDAEFEDAVRQSFASLAGPGSAAMQKATQLKRSVS